MRRREAAGCGPERGGGQPRSCALNGAWNCMEARQPNNRPGCPRTGGQRPGVAPDDGFLYQLPGRPCPVLGHCTRRSARLRQR